MKRFFWALLPMAFICLLSACGKKTAKTINKENKSNINVICPDLNADSVYMFTEAQCAFGPRVPNTEGHIACGNYIAAKFNSYGTEVTSQYADLKGFDGTILKSRNIIASSNPKAEKRILLCAHWDTRPWSDNDPDSANWHTPLLGANDGASGVAVLLEIARIIQQQPLSNIGIDFVCFDSEDRGVPQWDESGIESSTTWCLGSQYWAQNPHKPGYKALYGILLDMVGGRGATFSQEGYSMEFAPSVVYKVWSTAESLGYGQYFLKRPSGYMVDDHVPVNQIAGIPCIDIVPYHTDGPSSFGPTWHTIKDNMDNIDKNVLKAVGQTVLQVIYNENKNHEHH